MKLLIAGVFGVVAGASPSFAVVAIMAGLWSVGVGGNLPVSIGTGVYCNGSNARKVDSAVFLEFLPGSHQWLLTIMSIWWAFGQIGTKHSPQQLLVTCMLIRACSCLRYSMAFYGALCLCG